MNFKMTHIFPTQEILYYLSLYELQSIWILYNKKKNLNKISFFLNKEKHRFKLFLDLKFLLN